MLSTPPAFNLSQNQTLQFKSVQDSCFRRNRNLKDFLPTRYSLVNEPLGLFGPPARLVAAWREERLCPLSFPESTTFFSFRESFSRRPSVVFSRREERLCPLLLSKSTTFFRSVKLFVPPWSQSFFFNREERLCSPSLSKSTTFFHFLKLSFHREAKSFSSIARSGYAPPRSTSQPLFYILANFAETQCVDPVTREMHSKQTPLSCQHKNHFCTNIQANPPPKANFRGISTLPQPFPHPATAIAHPPARPIAVQCATLPHC